MMAEQNDILAVDSAAVMKHLDIYQGIINRMAANSAECKKWAVALVSAILVLVVDKGKTEFVVVAVVPAVLFFFIDAYYLALERSFIGQQKIFLDKLHLGQLSIEELYVVKGPKSLPSGLFNAFGSWSVWPFYLSILGVFVLVKWIASF